MGAAILCVGVMVNLHITLLLDRIETWCMDQGGGSLGAWGSLGERPVVVCRLATPSGDPSGGHGIWDLFIFYNWNFVALSGSLGWPGCVESLASSIAGET